MLEKLLALAPYNPSIGHQLRFYSRRMREEAGIRRIGLVFIVLTFFVQFFAVLSPPQPSVAASSNDLINGGVSSPGDAGYQCDHNVQQYKRILEWYGISCNDVHHGDDGVTIHSGARDYYSAGHIQLGSRNPNTGKLTHEHAANIPEVANPVYWRLLNSWDSASSAPYPAIRVTASGNNGQTFYILKGCGNLVAVGIPEHPTAVGIIQPGPSLPQPTPPTQPPPPPPKCPLDSTLLASDSRCVPCPYNNTIIASNNLCKPCDKSSTIQDNVACIEARKTATNVTQSIKDANNTTAQPGDVIMYTLYAQNTGKGKLKKFTFTENLSDVMDYATVTDLHGGTIDATNQVTWTPVDIGPGQTATVQITVTVKNPIPSTPASTSDPNHFDLIMTNVYGNAINIKVPSPPVKTIQTATTSLPNTGPGTSLFVVGTIMVIAGYFYSRSRLLARESEIAIKETAVA